MPQHTPTTAANSTASTTTPSSSATPLPPFKQSFLETCLTNSILAFKGPYTLKSGRQSPYFFNAGLFHTGLLVRALSLVFAQTLISYSSPPLAFDVLFGPAYKGISLAATTVDKLAKLEPARFENVSFSFNRKEAKDHGEGGTIVGAGLKGKKVMIIDDVVTAGTAKREAVDLIKAQGGEVVGIIVALDRMETVVGEEDGQGEGLSAVGYLGRELGIPVLSVLTLEDLIGGLKALGKEEEAKDCEEYRQRYGARA
ncbi:orotate phosphoribosyltransferase [Agyrium rufum]|nr:orotate phosphoribosyltransferase [Agyrium rufum]